MYRMVISLILMLLVAIFSIQNKDVVYVTFLIWNLQIPLVILVISAATLGAVMVGLMGIVKQISMGGRIRELNGKLKKAENENSSLKEKLSTAEKSFNERNEVLGGSTENRSTKDQQDDGFSKPDNTSKEGKQETLLNPTFPIRSE